MRLTKEAAVRRIHECAVAYHENLLGRNVLFLTFTGNASSYFESAFFVRNFLHFTGVTTILNPTQYFRAALNNKLSKDDICLNTDGTSELKLDVLPTLMRIHLVARMVGDYDNSKSLLVTDKIAGTVTAAMGFAEDKETGYYIPNTVLKEDLRKLTKKPQQRIVATFRKTQKEERYSELSYFVKDISELGNGVLTVINDRIDSELNRFFLSLAP